jgi:hypothetical protein
MNIRASIWPMGLCIALFALTAAACHRAEIETPRPEDVTSAEPLTIDACMNAVGTPNGPRPQACVADYRTCLKGC